MWLRKSNCSKAGSWFCRHQLRQTISWPQMGYFLLLWRSWLLIKKKLNKKEFFAFYLIELTESEHLSKFSRQYELQSEDNGPKVCVCVYVRCFWVSLVYWVIYTFDSTGEKQFFLGSFFSLAFYYQSNTLCTDLFFIYLV